MVLCHGASPLDSVQSNVRFRHAHISSAARDKLLHQSLIFRRWTID